MIEAVHITPTKNIPSILKNGILRSKPILDTYNDVMKNEYGNKYNPEKGLVFGFPEGHFKRDKFIKDFFYWKTWGNPRNILITKTTDNQYDNIQNIGINIFNNLRIKPDHFSVVLIEVNNDPIFKKYVHCQSHYMGPLWTDMDEKYEHDDKPLTLINYDIPPNLIKGIIATGETYFSKNGKIKVRYY